MIRIGIIGMGRMGITHYSIINSRSEVLITAVADTSSLVLSLIKKYIPKIKTYKDYNDLINSGEVDALLVCTPPNLNKDILTKAASNNIHCFVEKPYLTSIQDGLVISELFKGKQLVNQVGYVNRFNDVFKHTKALIQSNLIGEVYRFKSEMFSCTISQDDSGAGWRASRESGGGAVFEMAAHAIDLVNYLIGSPSSVSGTSLNKVYSKNVEDVVSTTFNYEGNLSGTVYVNWSDHSYRKPTNKIEVTGKEGKILADQHSLKVFLKDIPEEGSELRQGWNTIYITDIFEPVDFYVRGNEFTRQLYEFVDQILKQSQASTCTFDDGCNTLRVIDQIFSDYESMS